MRQDGFAPLLVFIVVILIGVSVGGAYYLGATHISSPKLDPTPTPVFTNVAPFPSPTSVPLPSQTPTLIPTIVNIEAKLQQAIDDCQIIRLVLPHQGSGMFILKDQSTIELSGKTESQIKIMTDSIKQKCGYTVLSIIE